MEQQFIFKHYKGAEYQQLGIALPLRNSTLPLALMEQLEEDFDSPRYHENTHDVLLKRFDGRFFIDSEVPCVIYESVETGKKWAREVDDFYGFTQNEEGQWVKRFELNRVNLLLNP